MTIYRVNYPDGREFRVLCANRNQTKLFNASIGRLRARDPAVTVSEIINGVHPQAIFADIVKWQIVQETEI